jgi:hypothetical protein
MQFWSVNVDPINILKVNQNTFISLFSDKAPSEATFRGSEYLSYDLSRTGGEPIVSTQDAISLNFKTRQPSGLLFYTGKGQLNSLCFFFFSYFSRTLQQRAGIVLFTWRLHSALLILARLVTAQFMQRDGKTGIRQTNNVLRGGVRSIVTCARCSHCAYNGEMLFCIVVLSRTYAKSVILTFHHRGPLFLQTPR